MRKRGGGERKVGENKGRGRWGEETRRVKKRWEVKREKWVGIKKGGDGERKLGGN